GVGSERSYELLTLSLQTLGGSGYLQDYPIEQYIRDAKIDSLYEGTTGIQGLDFFFRKMVRDQGAAAQSLLAEVAAFAAADNGNGRLEVPRAFRTVHPLGWTIWKGKIVPRPKKSFSPEYKDEGSYSA
ncbi:MAG: acyl-CoA dehydrogenase family protein, partial [Streptosporangiaceae bacterium]